MGKIYLLAYFLYFLLSCQSFCGQTMAKGIFEEYYSQVAIIACVPKFSVQKARKGADKVTLLLLQEPKNARIEKDNNQEFEKRVPESQDMQKIGNLYRILSSVFCISGVLTFSCRFELFIIKLMTATVTSLYMS